jgi:aminoglycoside phosphotransferase (APT) family kinase protein
MSKAGSCGTGPCPDYAPAERRAIYEAEIDTLAALHNVDYAAVGLADYGKPGNYFARQIDRWTKQYKASETEPDPGHGPADRLAARQSCPVDDKTSIVHGDYRLDNMILHAGPSRSRAVLDWELSTLGNPLADFRHRRLAAGQDHGRAGALPRGSGLELCEEGGGLKGSRN